MGWKHGQPPDHCRRCGFELVPERDRRAMEGSPGIGCRSCNASLPTSVLPPRPDSRRA
jgi:hypothetical protein